MIDIDTAVSFVTVHERRPEETNAHYERRLEDPLAVATANADERLRLAALADEAYKTSMEAGQVGDAIEFAADYAYRSLGVLPHKLTHERAKQGRELATTQLELGEDISPLSQLDLEMRRLDLLSVEVLTAYLAAKEKTAGSDARKADQAYEAFQAQTIRQGAEALRRAQEAHQASNDEHTKQLLRGKMFELLYTTYLRNRIYQADMHDPPIAVGATRFEDESAKSFQPYSHNYDVLVLGDTGEVWDIIQCKNARSSKQYHESIHKVSGRGFKRFIEDPTTFIKALDTLVSNRPDISEEALKGSEKLLDGLFEDELYVAQSTGQLAMSASKL